MKRKKQFVTPRVIQEVSIQLEKDLLGGSIQNDMTLKSMGISVENYDFSGPENAETGYAVYWE